MLRKSTLSRFVASDEFGIIHQAVICKICAKFPHSPITKLSCATKILFPQNIQNSVFMTENLYKWIFHSNFFSGIYYCPKIGFPTILKQLWVIIIFIWNLGINDVSKQFYNMCPLVIKSSSSSLLQFKSFKFYC